MAEHAVSRGTASMSRPCSMSRPRSESKVRARKVVAMCFWPGCNPLSRQDLLDLPCAPIYQNARCTIHDPECTSADSADNKRHPTGAIYRLHQWQTPCRFDGVQPIKLGTYTPTSHPHNVNCLVTSHPVHHLTLSYHIHSSITMSFPNENFPFSTLPPISSMVP